MIIAFTGTRQGLTAAQRAALPKLLDPLPDRVLHGGAVGKDEEFHNQIEPLYAIVYPAVDVLDMLFSFDSFKLPVTIYPTFNRYLYWENRARNAEINIALEQPRAALIRNRLMVACCDRLLACDPVAGWQR